MKLPVCRNDAAIRPATPARARRALHLATSVAIGILVRDAEPRLPTFTAKTTNLVTDVPRRNCAPLWSSSTLVASRQGGDPLLGENPEAFFRRSALRRRSRAVS